MSCRSTSYYVFLFLMLSGVLDAKRVKQSSLTISMLDGDAGVKEGTTTVTTTLRPLPPPLTVSQRKKDRHPGFPPWAVIHCQLNGCTLRDKFCYRSKDNCKTVEDGQEIQLLEYDRVVKELETAPERELSGDIRRQGDLGGFIMNDLLWENDWMTFPIGADLADHRKVRPTADRILNTQSGSNPPRSEAWDRDMIRERAQEFFRTRREFKEADIRTWNCKILHKILFNMDLTDIEATDFEHYKSSSLKLAVVPKWMASTFFDIAGIQKERDRLLEKYMDAMKKDTRGFWSNFEGRDLRFAADFGLTAMTSAGGVSIPITIRHALAIIYGDRSPLREAERKLEPETLWPFVYEVFRRYAPVTQFPYWTSDLKTRYVANVGFALMNEEHWEDYEKFKLRTSEYEKKLGSGIKIGLAWAEQAMGPDGLTPDSRGCPARDLSMTIVTEFLRAMIPTQSQWSITEKAGENGLKLPEGDQQMMPDFTITRGANTTLKVNAEEKEQLPDDKDDKDQKAKKEAVLTMHRACNTFKGKPERTPFVCPSECTQCCKTKQSSSAFKCIVPDTPTNLNYFKIIGRECSKPTTRNSDEAFAKSYCKFTLAEEEAGWFDELASCNKTPWGFR